MLATFNYSPPPTVDAEVEGANQLKGTFTYTTALSGCPSGKSAYIVQKGKWVKRPLSLAVADKEGMGAIGTGRGMVRERSVVVWR